MVIIDNGHGVDTPGKCSPDGRYYEWSWSREVARGLKAELERRGVEACLLVPEDADVPMRTRLARAKAICRKYGNAVLVSIHSNAGGWGASWGRASGWMAYVCRDASPESRRLAAMMTEHAIVAGLEGTRATPLCRYWEADFSICKYTGCPAVLTENLFHDNEEDVVVLLSAEGKAKIIGVHADAICEYYACL